MTDRKQTLELTWIGKEKRPTLEPELLLEETERSYHASSRVNDEDIFDNRLIFGDNLLALKALEQEFSGRIRCVYIDPPFNTQQALEHYDDGLEHSLWLSFMRDRLEILWRLLAPNGTLFVHIDDNELGYLIVLLDEVFGRNNRVCVVTFKQGSATGHKAINPGCANTTNYLLIYARDKASWAPNRLFTARVRDTRYNQFITNIECDYTQWNIGTLTSAFAVDEGISEKEARSLGRSNPANLDAFVERNAQSVVRMARPYYQGVSAAARKLIDESQAKPETVLKLCRENHSDMYFLKGERILFYSDKLKLIDGRYVAGEPLTTLWDDVLSNNLHNEGGVRFSKGKKPEALIKRVLELATDPGDWVLDSFAGSGTTGAVAHKMKRRWIILEFGEHCHTHILPRLRRVIDGKDLSGITQATDWKGGGGFRYFRLAPSRLEKGKGGQRVVNEHVHPEILAEAVCKIEGFRYAPSETVFWQHGQSSERDFIYVTTQNLSAAQLEFLSAEVGESRSLLVMCSAFRAKVDRFPNLTVKKISKAVLSRCEWGHDDYSLQVENLPQAPAKPRSFLFEDMEDR